MQKLKLALATPTATEGTSEAASGLLLAPSGEGPL
jgi:hypothetical protein